ncbi:hypothetical protein H7H78_08025 [Mycobacterium shinjukuense]|uniref:Uncharacterized protein n=1 Tax=Mycobacterium shinjukuense TaxID=398694 RepID=A0A7I7MQK4_9MYCO|nr:hypothetical protein [Mycobacterium shinjukuense]MCV6985380.1 hypothetical protein [Mycobacterium shinjukuense]ORB66477.1 hypothetical protein BST45_13950 [Mycobacterium shinjukuense]BBX74525.1 hypothetical protein MSHI_24310 [Mycobacterium shinjukuense]
MASIDNYGPHDELPEADVAEQRRTVDFDDEAGLDTAYLGDHLRDRDANEADVIDQATVVPLSDDDRDIDR